MSTRRGPQQHAKQKIEKHRTKRQQQAQKQGNHRAKSLAKQGRKENIEKHRSKI